MIALLLSCYYFRPRNDVRGKKKTKFKSKKEEKSTNKKPHKTWWLFTHQITIQTKDTALSFK